LGPLIALIIFVTVGDSWTLPELNTVMMAGLCLAVLPCATCFLFNDDYALGAESDAVTERRPEATSQEQAAEEEKVNQQRSCFGLLTPNNVPAIQFASSLVMGLASGMTSKYWAQFFKDEVHIGPVAVNALFVICPILQSVCSVLAQLLSRRIGRVQVVLGCIAVCIPQLYVVALARSIWGIPTVVCTLYITRTAIMNCFSPISKSILNDFAPKASRGRWNSMSAFQQLGWSGSALLGGFLISSGNGDNYGLCFTVTASIQVVGLALRCLLIPIVATAEQAYAIDAAVSDVDEDRARLEALLAEDGGMHSSFSSNISGSSRDRGSETRSAFRRRSTSMSNQFASFVSTHSDYPDMSEF